MLQYARGSELREYAEAGLKGVAFDGWLEGWASGFLQMLFRESQLGRVLDIEMGGGERPYQEALSRRADQYARSTEAELSGETGSFDLVLAFSYDREKCLNPVDRHDPYYQAATLSSAAARLMPGGMLVWSYLHAFPEEELRGSLLDPAAVYRSLLLRGGVPGISESMVRQMEAYHDSDTLFVHQDEFLPRNLHHRRLARVVGAVRRPERAAATPVIGTRPVHRRLLDFLWRV